MATQITAATSYIHIALTNKGMWRSIDKTASSSTTMNYIHQTLPKGTSLQNPIALSQHPNIPTQDQASTTDNNNLYKT